jgi:hypothetical protein
MDDDPIDLDNRRSSESRMATDIRRHALRDFEMDQLALRKRQEELEVQLLAEPAANWREEAAIKAQYLIRRYAACCRSRGCRSTTLRRARPR